VDFAARVRELEKTRGTRLAIALAPSLERMPYPIQRFDDPFLPYGRAVIDATSDIACAYVFDLAAYLSVGASSAIALERTIAYVPAQSLTILHGMFTRAEYARLLSTSAFAADAATLATVDELVIASFLSDSAKGVLVDGKAILPLMPYWTGWTVSESTKQRLGWWVEALPTGHVLEFPGEGDVIRWLWRDEISYASRSEDFQDEIRSAAQKYVEHLNDFFSG